VPVPPEPAPVAPGASGTLAEPSPGAWSAFWEEAAHLRIHRVEADDHLERLCREVPLRPTDRVLDFGCGFGHVAALLATVVASVGYWDAAEQMRTATAATTAALEDRVVPVDLSGPPPDGAAGSFDLVLANSVVQYMSADELAGWLPRWRALLAPGGRIVLSDLPRPGASDVAELVGMVRFAARRGFLVQAVREAASEARRYSSSRSRTTLRRWAPEEFARFAAGLGMGTSVLPANLTHRAGRFTVLLTPR
jgi:cyclopropane fatty-acyl-phospholipid synthase-like methyltransferase